MVTKGAWMAKDKGAFSWSYQRKIVILHRFSKWKLRGAHISVWAEIIPIEPETDNADAGIDDPFIIRFFTKRVNMKRSFMALVALSCTTGMVQANDNEPVDTLKTYQLQGVQVTSTRANNKTPMAFSNLSSDEIKKVNFGLDIPYVLSLTPSVTTTSDAGNGIGYTTLRVRGTDPSRINITANGIPVSDAESSTTFWVNMADFTSSVQSMQIQRGVGTSTNGAGAFGATINMQTENIGVRPFVGVDLSAGSYYSHKETVRFGTGLINDHWGLQGRLSNIGSKGYLDRASAKLNSYFLQAGYFGDNTMVKFITWNGMEETYHAWNYTSKYEQSLYGRQYNSCGEYYDENGNVHYYKNQTDNYHQQNYQLIWNQMFTPHWTLNTAVHYTRGDGYYDEYKSNKNLQDYGLSDTKFKTDLTRQKKMANDFYGAIASVTYNNLAGLQMVLGGGWNKYDGDHFGLVNWVKEPQKVLYPGYEYYRNNSKKTDGNVYGKVNWNFWQGMSAFVDLQYRHVNYKMQDPSDYYIANRSSEYVLNENFDFFNPKFGINYDITDNHKVYVSYAISHKEPVRNNYQNYWGTIDSKVNKNEKPVAEQLNDLELGYKYQSKAFSAGLNLYYMNYKNQFVLTGELDDIGEAKTKNFDKSYRMGVELEAAWKPVDWFRWDINATFSKNKVKDMTVGLDDGSVANLGTCDLAFSPSAILNNIFSFNYQGFSASIQSQYTSKQNLTNTGISAYNNYKEDGSFDQSVDMCLKEHFTTNVDLSYRFSLHCLGLKDATVGVTFYNIFSAKYDNNGWAAPSYRKGANGQVEAFCTEDLYEAGFAPSAPFNWMAHLSLNF